MRRQSSDDGEAMTAKLMRNLSLGVNVLLLAGLGLADVVRFGAEVRGHLPADNRNVRFGAFLQQRQREVNSLAFPADAEQLLVAALGIGAVGTDDPVVPFLLALGRRRPALDKTDPLVEAVVDGVVEERVVSIA